LLTYAVWHRCIAPSYTPLLLVAESIFGNMLKIQILITNELMLAYSYCVAYHFQRLLEYTGDFRCIQ
jgi:hypothetical protein